MLTITSLTHPTMIAKVRLAMRLAGTGRGHEMNGHANRTYITNRKGRNIIRCSYWKAKNEFQFWGDQGRDITLLVKAALSKANAARMNSIIPSGGIRAGSIVAISAFTTGCIPLENFVMPFTHAQYVEALVQASTWGVLAFGVLGCFTAIHSFFNPIK